MRREVAASSRGKWRAWGVCVYGCECVCESESVCACVRMCLGLERCAGAADISRHKLVDAAPDRPPNTAHNNGGLNRCKDDTDPGMKSAVAPSCPQLRPNLAADGTGLQLEMHLKKEEKKS